MEYEQLGYFVAVCILVFGSLLGWLIRMIFLEKKVIERLNFLESRPEETPDREE